MRTFINFWRRLSASDGQSKNPSPAAGKTAGQRELVLQLSPFPVNDGGAVASLAMVLAYHGYPVDQKTLQTELWLPDGGTDAVKMIHSAQARGLQAKGVRVEEKESLVHVPVGSIVHRNDSRFQVLEEVAGDRVTVLDPLTGRRTLSIDDFWGDFSGVALLFE